MASRGLANACHLLWSEFLFASILLALRSDGFLHPSSPSATSAAPLVGELARAPRPGSSRSRGAVERLRMAPNPPESAAGPVAAAAATVPSWNDLARAASDTPVGRALDADADLRRRGLGAPHVQITLRLFGSQTSSERSGSDELPNLILYRDHAGWYGIVVLVLVNETRGKTYPSMLLLLLGAHIGKKVRCWTPSEGRRS
jgi:hypothetical protein